MRSTGNSTIFDRLDFDIVGGTLELQINRRFALRPDNIFPGINSAIADVIYDINNTIFGSISNDIGQLPPDDVNDALFALSNGAYGSLVWSHMRNISSCFHSISNNIKERKFVQTKHGDIWSSIYGVFHHQHSPLMNSFAFDGNAGGAIIGMDKTINSSLVIGFALSDVYSKISLKKRGDANTNSAFATIFSGYNKGNVALEGIVAYGYSWQNMKRIVPISNATYSLTATPRQYFFSLHLGASFSSVNLSSVIKNASASSAAEYLIPSQFIGASVTKKLKKQSLYRINNSLYSNFDYHIISQRAIREEGDPILQLNLESYLVHCFRYEFGFKVTINKVFFNKMYKERSLAISPFLGFGVVTEFFASPKLSFAFNAIPQQEIDNVIFRGILLSGAPLMGISLTNNYVQLHINYKGLFNYAGFVHSAEVNFGIFM